MTRIARSLLPLIIASTCLAQTPASEFEVATIKPSAPQGQQGQVSVGVHIDGAQVRVIRFSLRDYLGLAYRMKATMISGPDWTASDRFDISATLPAGGNPAQLADLFKALLVDRFKVKVHSEKKEFPVYALMPSKAPLKLKVTPSDPAAESSEPKGTVNVSGAGSAAGVGVNLGQGSSYSFANNRFEAKKLTMAQFAANLERFADRPIIDATGLTASYDFAIEFTPEDYRAMLIRAAISAGVNLPPEAMRALEGTSEGALSDALQQVGLRLEARKAPLDVLVIDDALKAPIAN
jgi:uncharacterized protein (TIGR03435 family)